MIDKTKVFLFKSEDHLNIESLLYYLEDYIKDDTATKEELIDAITIAIAVLRKANG